MYFLMYMHSYFRLKKLQEEMIDGGRRAGDKNLKERRKRKKAAAENRIKALGEALGHVDDEDGVLIKVYDDIQEELKVKNEALKKGKQKVSVLLSDTTNDYKMVSRHVYLLSFSRHEQSSLNGVRFYIG